MCLDDLVIIAKVSHPIPFRTRPLNPFALMVLRLKARESKSLPDLPNISSSLVYVCYEKPCYQLQGFFLLHLLVADGKRKLFGELLGVMIIFFRKKIFFLIMQKNQKTVTLYK